VCCGGGVQEDWFIDLDLSISIDCKALTIDKVPILEVKSVNTEILDISYTYDFFSKNIVYPKI